MALGVMCCKLKFKLLIVGVPFLQCPRLNACEWPLSFPALTAGQVLGV